MGSEKYSLTCRCDAPATMHSFALFLSLFLSLLEPLTRNEISYVCMSLCMRVRMRLRVCACVRVGSLSGNQLLLHPGADTDRHRQGHRHVPDGVVNLLIMAQQQLR
jgi:hypothetical protein